MKLSEAERRQRAYDRLEALFALWDAAALGGLEDAPDIETYPVIFVHDPVNGWMPDMSDDAMPDSLAAKLIIDRQAPLTDEDIRILTELQAQYGVERLDELADVSLTWEEIEQRGAQERIARLNES